MSIQRSNSSSITSELRNTCPRCQGCLAGPEWDVTPQGRVYQVWCINCGWRVSDPHLMEYTAAMRRSTRGSLHAFEEGFSERRSELRKSTPSNRLRLERRYRILLNCIFETLQ